MTTLERPTARSRGASARSSTRTSTWPTFVQHNAVHDYGDAPRRIHRIEVAPEAPATAR